MLIKEYIGKSDKNHMISTLLKYYGVKGVKIKEKSMKDHAHYNVDTGTLELSTRYKTIKKSQIKEFLITIIHEIDHAMDAKKYGWKKFKKMYEMEMNYLIGQGKDEYDDNKYEIKAEKFGQKNWKRWYAWFKRENII
jgi:hypothetical protein